MSRVTIKGEPSQSLIALLFLTRLLPTHLRSISIFLGFFLSTFGLANFEFVNIAFASTSLRTVQCNEAAMISIYITPNQGTIINFPVKPENVVLGSKKLFGIEFIKNDLALTALTPSAKTNLFVYLQGRRCGFQLMTSKARQDNLIKVSDSESDKLKVQIK